jgi:iron complex transport system substrate-binding protein
MTMRIASLLPSATDIVASLSLIDNLVGRTHECDWPPEVQVVPVLTRDVLDTSSMGTREIHEAIETSVHSGSSIYQLDVEALREAEPDLILTQELCQVCAVSYTQVAKAARLIDAEVKVLSLEPRGIADILNHIQLVANLAGVPKRGARIVRELRSRLEKIASAVKGRPRPSVASLEWLDPLFCAGHWVPEQVATAGGREPLGVAGEHSREVDWSSVVLARPEFILLMPCGHPIDRAAADLALLRRMPRWEDIPAVGSGRVWAVDGPAYFNRPGPRVVRGVEVVASVLHGVGGAMPTEARRLS